MQAAAEAIRGKHGYLHVSYKISNGPAAAIRGMKADMRAEIFIFTSAPEKNEMARNAAYRPQTKVM